MPASDSIVGDSCMGDLFLGFEDPVPASDSFVGDSCMGDHFLGVASRKRALSCDTPFEELLKESGTQDTSRPS